MKAVYFIEKGKTAILDNPIPVCADDTVLLKTLYSGMTNGTERNVLMGGNYGGTFPTKCAYQLVSEVVERGAEITGFNVGDIVYTGTFPGHVEYHLAKENDLMIKLPDGVDPQEAALLGVVCVPLHDARRADVRIDDNVLVVGGGLIGQFASQAAQVMGSKVTMADIDDRRLELAKTLGADEVVNTSEPGGLERLHAGKPYSVVFESSGANVLSDIVGTGWLNGLIGYRGRILMIAGRFDVTYNFNAAQSNELALMHISHFDQTDLEHAVRLLQKGRIKIRPLIKDIVSIDDAVGIYDTLRDDPNALMGTVFKW